MPLMSKPLPRRPDIDRLLIEAQKRFDAMTPDQQRAMRQAQRKSWVVGETMLSNPNMTREEAEEIYHKVVEGVGL